MWLVLVLKVALVVFLVVGTAAIVVTYIRRSRTARFRQEPNPTLGSLSQMGVVPPTPLPEWVHWTDSDHPSGPQDDATPPEHGPPNVKRRKPDSARPDWD